MSLNLPVHPFPSPLKDGVPFLSVIQEPAQLLVKHHCENQSVLGQQKGFICSQLSTRVPWLKYQEVKNFSFVFFKNDVLDVSSITALFIVVTVWEIRRKTPQGLAVPHKLIFFLSLLLKQKFCFTTEESSCTLFIKIIPAGPSFAGSKAL